MSRAKPPEEKLGNSVLPAKKQQVTDVEWETPVIPDTVWSQDLWVGIWELGGPTGVYHPVADYQLVKRYCELVQRREDLMTQLTKEGYTVEGSQGQLVQHPAARMVSDIESKLVPLEDRLGLNPQARHTIQISKVEATSALEKWLKED